LARWHGIGAKWQGARAGERVGIVIRPEYVGLAVETSSATPLHDNQFRGRAIAIAFMGETTEYRIMTEGGVVLTARKPLSDRIENGTPVVITLQAECVAVLPRE
jgi:ABC-type Fe3+/spermidine/putrescine transport system ATPase subunit